MVEFHVDHHPDFQDLAEELPFGGDLSVRKPPNLKPAIVFGQDECIFKQYAFTPKAWSTPDGQTPVIPKDDGLGVMISAFVSREFGFGMQLSPEQLEEVNRKRRGETYQDKEASTKVNGNNRKTPLKISPFMIEFEYGANCQGYWDYDRMVPQVEDCIDVLKTLYADEEYEWYFNFDHSCGHDRQRPDGLSMTKLCKGYGGSQPRM